MAEVQAHPIDFIAIERDHRHVVIRTTYRRISVLHPSPRKAQNSHFKNENEAISFVDEMLKELTSNNPDSKIIKDANNAFRIIVR